MLPSREVDTHIRDVPPVLRHVMNTFSPVYSVSPRSRMIWPLTVLKFAPVPSAAFNAAVGDNTLNELTRPRALPESRLFRLAGRVLEQ